MQTEQERIVAALQHALEGEGQRRQQVVALTLWFVPSQSCLLMRCLRQGHAAASSFPMLVAAEREAKDTAAQAQQLQVQNDTANRRVNTANMGEREDERMGE